MEWLPLTSREFCAPNLESLCVYDCSILEEIFHFEGILFDDHYQGQAATPIVLSYDLVEVKLRSPPKLTSIWSGSPQLLGNFPTLYIIALDGCQSLRTIFSCPSLKRISSYQGVPNLERLSVYDCRSLEEIFHFEGILSDDHYRGQAATPIVLSYDLVELPMFEKHLFMPKFKMLFLISSYDLVEVKLRSLSELTSIWSGSSQLLRNFSALNTLAPDGCQSLRSIFSCPSLKCLSSYQGAPNLETLYLNDCSSLEEIFHFVRILSDDHHQGQAADPIVLSYGLLNYLELTSLPKLTSIWSGSPQLLVNLPALNTLHLNGCQRLRSIFSVAMIPSLAQLECLPIRDCQKLEEIIAKGKEDEADLCTTHHDPPQLHLQLVGLKELLIRSFPIIKCLGLGAPKLETLVKEGCPLLEEIVDKEEGKDVILFPNVRFLTVSYWPRLLRTPFGFATPSLFQAHPLCLIAPSNLRWVTLCPHISTRDSEKDHYCCYVHRFL
uniref:Disease resistance protein At4g27190-like leucine-rich repeats domain-containing protein n=1 Tax=Nelumbo nucifera TaxID=4432 RepID=A0A822ZJE2_NELNU|nr:TPA_asm: hypothetical protein HUJ06_001971 [Nelumbo nucifera]